MDPATILTVTEILPQVYLTSAPAAFVWVAEGKADLVVDLSTTPDASCLCTVHLPLIDREELPSPLQLSLLLHVAELALACYRAGLRVLFHCVEGKNRSALALGVFLYLAGFAKGQAIVDLIRAKRPGTLSNATFARYLAGLGVPCTR